MKRILMYKYSIYGEEPVYHALVNLGYVVDVLNGQFENFDEDNRYENAISTYLQECALSEAKCDAVLTLDYIPLLSRICENHQIIYISWVVDSPLSTLYSRTILNKCNRFFVFDLVQCDELQKAGATCVHHMPLACNISQWESLKYTDEDEIKYKSEVSFVGSLYNDFDSNKYNHIHTFPPHLKGYLDGLISAQLNVYGYNLLDECLHDEIINEIKEYLKLDLGPLYFDNYKTLLSNILNKQVTMLERLKVINELSRMFDVDLYTGSDISSITGKNIKLRGIVDYMTEMPKVFRYSKINLNITSKSIKSGIPLRVFDILGAGGFLISNYQNEIAQYFENGVEVVLYDSVDDLVDKVDYYLKHEDEREKIAQAGYYKVKLMYSYDKKLQEIMQIAEKY